jgi:hypothetical protein
MTDFLIVCLTAFNVTVTVLLCVLYFRLNGGLSRTFSISTGIISVSWIFLLLTEAIPEWQAREIRAFTFRGLNAIAFLYLGWRLLGRSK